MKKFVETVALIKATAGMIFAGQIIVYVIAGSFFGLSEIAFKFIWQALFIALITGILQFVAFTDYIIKNMLYVQRILVFILPLYIVLAGFAVFFKWFSFSIGTWLTFTAIFIFVFGVITTTFEIYSRITGKKYIEKLVAYKNNTK